ncbi:MAG: sigma-70 family RNA polymerase sigma factor [Pirellulales bacterium]|nr:sigma-70 family RNA polymerase sigma factor [Pirellulales bacterium]
MSDVTQLLSKAESGDCDASDALFAAVYDDLRQLARDRMAKEQAGHTLQPTDLVHESFVRLIGADQQQDWQSKAHFFAAASEAMRWILVDHARRKKAAKRGGKLARVQAQPEELPAEKASEDEILAVDEAVEKLASQDPQKADLVKLRYFGGMTLKEAAIALGLSRATAARHWKFAKAWLAIEISDEW